MKEVLEPGAKVRINGLECTVNSVTHYIDGSYQYELVYMNGIELKYEHMSKDLFESLGGTVVTDDTRKIGF